MKNQIRIVRYLSLALLFGAFVLPQASKAQQQPETTAASEDADAQSKLDKVWGADGVLNSLGLKNTKVVEAEMKLDVNSGGPEGRGFDTDGPSITLETELSDRVRAQVKFAFQELMAVESNQFVRPMNWETFIDEAKIIIDQDPKSRIPFVTIIGKQELDTGSNDSDMPIEDLSPLHGLTKIPGAYAVQFQMDNHLIKALDSVVFSAFTTGRGSEDYQGVVAIPNAKGAMVVISKKLTDRISVTGSLTSIAYPAQTENRLNWSAVYQSEKGGYKVFFDQAVYNYDPLYANSKFAMTIGVSKKISKRNTVTAEATRVDGVKTQYGVGINHRINKHTSVGVGVRHDRCVEGQCVSGTKVEGQLRYSFEREEE